MNQQPITVACGKQLDATGTYNFTGGERYFLERRLAEALDPVATAWQISQHWGNYSFFAT